MSKSLVSAFHIKPNNSLIVNDYDIFQDKELLENLKDKIIERVSDLKDETSITSDLILQSIDYNTKDLNLSNAEKTYLYNLADNEINGYGPLTEIMKDNAVKTIMVNSPNDIYIETETGYIKENNISFINDEHIVKTIKKLIEPLNIELNSSLLNTKLKDGSKLSAILPPLTLNPVLMIKKYNHDIASLEDLIRLGTITPYMATYLDTAIKANLNILTVGFDETGKSIFIDALSNSIDNTSRVVVIDPNNNLNIPKEHLITLSNEEKYNMIDIASSLNANYILISDVTKDNLLDTLNLMNTKKGILASINMAPSNILENLESKIVFASKNMETSKMLSYLKNSIDLVVILDKTNDNKRKVINILEFDNNELKPIFTYQNDEFSFNPRQSNNYKLMKQKGYNELDEIFKELS